MAAATLTAAAAGRAVPCWCSLGRRRPGRVRRCSAFLQPVGAVTVRPALVHASGRASHYPRWARRARRRDGQLMATDHAGGRREQRGGADARGTGGRHRGRAGRADRGLRAGQGRATPASWSRPTTWSAASAAPSSATAGASTSAATASSPRSRRSRTLWHEILPDEDFLLRPRMSRIYYEGKFYDYPLKAVNALGNLGLVEAVPLRACPTSGPGSGRRRTRPTRGLARRPLRLAALPHTSSRPTPRRSGASRSARSRPTGPPSGSRASSLVQRGRERRSMPQAQPDRDHHA